MRMFFTASSQASVAAALANDRPEKTVAWRWSTGYSLDRRASQSMAYVVRGSERSAVYACRKTPHRRDGVEERVRDEVLLDQGLQLGLFERRPQVGMLCSIRARWSKERCRATTKEPGGRGEVLQSL